MASYPCVSLFDADWGGTGSLARPPFAGERSAPGQLLSSLVVPARVPDLGSTSHHCGRKAAAWGYTEATRGGGCKHHLAYGKDPLRISAWGPPPEKQSAERGYGLSGRRIIPPSDLVYPENLVYPCIPKIR
jgi:hypothetical protein